VFSRKYMLARIVVTGGAAVVLRGREEVFDRLATVVGLAMHSPVKQAPERVSIGKHHHTAF
jgi:hypothetical protein